MGSSRRGAGVVGLESVSTARLGGKRRVRIAVEAWPLPQFSRSQTLNVDQ